MVRAQALKRNHVGCAAKLISGGATAAGAAAVLLPRSATGPDLFVHGFRGIS